MGAATEQGTTGGPSGDGQQPQRRPRRAVLLVAGVGALLVGGAAVISLVAAGSAGLDGRTSGPPWPAPTDVEQRARAAGLSMLTEEGTVLHLHEHLSVTVDGRAVTVPAHLGIDEAEDRIAAIHTHDRTGVLHVESPVRRTFRLGQAFTEWDVAFGPGRVGGYRDGRDGARVVVFVDRRPVDGDPRRIVLRERQDLDVVVTTDGSAPTPPAPYRFPSNY